jgi:NADPH2:quinone reductase
MTPKFRELRVCTVVTKSVNSMALCKRVVVREFGSPEVLDVECIYAPLVPVQDQIHVHVEAFGINPVETYVRAGLYDPLPSLPYTPGNDAAGIILALGPGVDTSQYEVGRRVWITGSVSGTYAQQCICNSADVHPLPDNLTFAQGASLGIPYRTAYRAICLIGGAKKGESVLVHGATGGVGIAALQIARMIGLSSIIATTSSEDQSVKRLLYECGATSVVKHGEYESKVDIIIECLANVNLGNDLKWLAKNGRVVVVGNRGEVAINPRDLMRCEGSILGMVGPGSADDKKKIDAAIQRGIESHQLRPVIGQVFSIEQIRAAHAEVLSHSKGTRGKIVVNTALEKY